MKLDEIFVNPENPRIVSEAQIEKLVGKLKRVPQGLKAMRIAYVVQDGKNTVIAGNTRLTVLKRLYGETAEVPDDWFADVTEMDEAERHEFIVTSNISDGEWDLDKLIEQYSQSEISAYGPSDLLVKLPFSDFNQVDSLFACDLSLKPKTVKCPYCGEENII